MIKLLIGGSPCTHWSIAQTKNRETAPEGIGWELFLNYLIARNKYAPDYFLYENNKSMSPSVREKIVERYYASEIDKYAVLTTQHNYPNTVQLGDAFNVRRPDWRLEP